MDALSLACARSLAFCISHTERIGGVKPKIKTKIVSNTLFSFGGLSLVGRSDLASDLSDILAPSTSLSLFRCGTWR